MLADAEEDDFTLRAPLLPAQDNASESQQGSSHQSLRARQANSPQVNIGCGQSWQLVASPPQLLSTSTTMGKPFVPATLPPFASANLQQPSQAFRSPPPLYYMPERPAIDSPFTVDFVHGNISRCNGCKGRISRGDQLPMT